MSAAPPLTPISASPQDQASRLRLVQARLDQSSAVAPPVPAPAPAPALRRPPLVIAVASGKGGVGKTNLTVNLAAQLARATRKRITVLDLDAGLANVDLLCSVDPRRRLSLAITSADDASVALAATQTQSPFGFTVIPGYVGKSDLLDARAPLAFLLDALSQTTDILLIDLGAGLGSWVRSGLSAADWPLIVTTPEPPALADAYALLKVVWSGPQPPASVPRIVVNTVRTLSEAEATFTRLAGVCERFLRITPVLSCALPDDPAVPHAVRSRALFTLQQPSSPAAQSLRSLTVQILHHVGESLFAMQDPQSIVAVPDVASPPATRPWSKLTRLIAGRLRS